MSSRKRPLSEIQNAQTPTRYAPSTPHAIRALQQRSGVKLRSARRTRPLSDTVRPDSARGILRQLARITAPHTKRAVPTPTVARGKENQTPRHEDDDEDNGATKQPKLTLDIDEEDSYDELVPPDVGDDDDEDDSELPAAPTPSVLPEDDDDGDAAPTVTFKSIDFARSARSPSRMALAVQSDPAGQEQDEDATILSEYGRRAISEEPTGRLSRYSFGSIRMSDFGTELEIRRESDHTRRKTLEAEQHDLGAIGWDEEGEEDAPVDLGGETENLGHLQGLASTTEHHQPGHLEESTLHIPALDESFQLAMPDEQVTLAHAHTPGVPVQSVEDYQPAGDDDDNGLVDVESPQPTSEPARVTTPSPPTPLTSTERRESAMDSALALGPTTHEPKPRRKKMKMTKHGEMVPSLPSSLIRRVALQAQERRGNRPPSLSREHMRALEQATEWFFEQAGEDLAAYSDHARRKRRVNESDVMMLMRRQRVLQGRGDLGKLAREVLPKELVEKLDLPDTL